MILFIVILLIAILLVILYTRLSMFGKPPSGDRLLRMQQSKNFENGKFKNQSYTPDLTEGTSITKVLYEFFFTKKPRKKPSKEIPSVKTGLHALPADKNVMVWFGHSSYFMQIDGKKILVDPVFSGNASPLPGTNKAFKGSDQYTTDDIPETDYLFITHDHYDHVDYPTIIRLRSKIKTVICGLGVGSHLEYWGFKKENIMELDWYETIQLNDGFAVHTTPARHFSGRGFKRNNTLWLSYVLQTPSIKIYLGGDSGYDSHFIETGKQHGPFDLAILDNGQYDLNWRYIHMLPEEVIMAAKDLGAKTLFPVHSAKFAMANHAWDDPLIRIEKLGLSDHIPMIFPRIGEEVDLKNLNRVYEKWWVGID